MRAYILLDFQGLFEYSEAMHTIANLGSPSQWMILIIVCLVIFGAKHLPEIARNLGKGLGEFKKARKQFEDELMKEDTPSAADPKKITTEEKPTASSSTQSTPAPEKKREEHIDA